MQATLNPYISFGGNAREALEFYKSVFGGEISISTFADQHIENAPADGVMHGQLTVDGSIILMGSDGMDSATIQGVSLSLSGTQADELRTYFEKLADGGTVTKSLEKESWGDEFGMVTDRFGVSWMVNIAGDHTSA
jgi:PhnB protein